MRISYFARYLLATAALAAPAVAEDYVVTSPGDLPFPTDVAGAVVIIGEDMTVTPASAPGWTDGTYLFNTNVVGVYGYQGHNSLVIEGGDFSAGVLRVGAGSGAYTHLEGMDEFAVRNMSNMGEGETGVFRGIISDSLYNRTSTNVLQIAGIGAVDISDNKHRVNTESGNVTALIETERNLYLAIAENGTVDMNRNLTLVEGGYYPEARGAIINSTYATMVSYMYGDVNFNGNRVLITSPSKQITVRGGVANCRNVISFDQNQGNVSVCGNTVEKPEGAIGYGEFLAAAVDGRKITFSKNTGKEVNICRNGFELGAPTTEDNTGYFVGGGALACSNTYDIISGNAWLGVGIEFKDNTAAVNINSNFIHTDGAIAYGGAIYTDGDTDYSNRTYITFSGNKKLDISGNTAEGRKAYGGAIYQTYSNFTMADNALVTVTGNSVRGTKMDDAAADDCDLKGGAIYSERVATFKVSNNDKVVFRGNAEVGTDGTTRLRSVYADLSETTAFEWSAADGGSLEVYDSITLVNNAEGNKQLNLNKVGGAAKDSTLVFSGRYTEADLAAVKGGAPTAAEVEASRTNSIEGATVKVQSGTLAIKDSAKLQIHGKTEADSSEFHSMDLVLEAGDIVFQDSALTKFDDVTLDLSRGRNGLTSHLTGSSTEAGGPVLQVTDGLTVNINRLAPSADETPYLAVEGFNLELDGEVKLNFVESGWFLADHTYTLFDFSQAGTGWDAFYTNLSDTFTINGVEYSTAGYLAYDAATGKVTFHSSELIVPETTTSTLSLLAIAVLAGRRRRSQADNKNTSI